MGEKWESTKTKRKDPTDWSSLLGSWLELKKRILITSQKGTFFSPMLEQKKLKQEIGLEETNEDFQTINDSNNSHKGKGSYYHSSREEPQDADYCSSKVPQLIDEVEAQILARVPRSEYGKFSLVNKRFLSLLKSGEIYKVRREFGFKEPTVFMLAAGQNWWAFDRHFNALRELPHLPGNYAFHNADKETLCVGTHLLVSGKEDNGGCCIWRYNLVTNRWLKGPSMINSRNLFAWASCGAFGYVAGGLFEGEYLSSAERYNPESETWESLPDMHKKRGNCSGFYMDKKFYVIGGRNRVDGVLTCAEAYDVQSKTWQLIPNMLEGTVVMALRSPPLVAVVDDELYSLDPSLNQVKVYAKQAKSWRALGPVPVAAGSVGGWGVAFKSLGNELLVIGGNGDAFAEGLGVMYVCRPNPDAEVLNWRLLEYGGNRLNAFICNCAVMLT
ncbi:F-box/kelch-repeat protein At3g27150 [Morus notabilis]|uniref:F-box/kelch-repeat protein At3g27150 n=1 Tax=Morus notabilis TaxID=981085 RepID=UPI000CED2262|nr:F-box/kelch-repeat protein At3g27150 [Morus notabilis]